MIGKLKTLFTVIGASARRFANWFRGLAPQNKAAVVASFLVLITLCLGWVAFSTRHPYPPLVILGLFYGIALAYLVTRFANAAIQSSLGSFIGGFSLGNLGSKGAAFSKAVTKLGDSIKSTVNQFVQAPGLSSSFPDAVNICVWTTIITAGVMVLANAFFVRKEDNP